MTETSDPTTLFLTGVLPIAVLAGAGLALVASIGLLALYRRTVRRSMLIRADLGTTATELTAPPSPTDPPARPDLVPSALDHRSSIAAPPEADVLHSTLLRAPWRAAAIYSVAGLCNALVLTAVWS